MKNDKLYVEQIIDSIQKIRRFVGEMNREEFDADQKTQSAVIMQLALIGELTKKLSPETKAKSDLPWKEIVGFRDRAIHDYFNVDLDVVWGTVESDLGEIEKKLK